MKRTRSFLLAGLLGLPLALSALPHDGHGQGGASDGALDFVANRGQWPDPVRFSATVPGGRLFLENDALTWHFVDPGSLADAHEEPSPLPREVRGHAFRARFLPLDGTPAGAVFAEGETPRDRHQNFFRGRNADRWAGRVPVYGGARLEGLYPGVDLRAYAQGSTFKYDLELDAGVDPTGIRIVYEGLDGVALTREGDLELRTSVNRLVELAPHAWQPGPDGDRPVACRYALRGDTLSFVFPEGFDPQRPLVIDPPTLIFGSYSGSLDDNWGYTATYDGDGALYGGGIAFGGNYPTTLGAYSTAWGGGGGTWPCDIAISKFSPDGSTLEWSTFLGGSGNDLPHSMICTPSGELWLYGTTGSTDFPVTPGCYDSTFNGGFPVTVTNVIVFPGGTDIFATKLSADGSALVGSTYLGGTGNDGLNLNPATGYNYGDHARGEIIVDRNGNAYIASTTLSANFPVTPGSIQTSFGGAQDGIVVKLAPGLDNLLFSTFLGGTAVDAAYSMKLGGVSGLVVAGGTTSTNFPTTPGAYQTSYQGGLADGWVARIAINGTALLESSYVGTADYDQIYFVETDDDQDVYITGQSLGAFPVSPGVYSNPGSAQFLAKMDRDLSGFQYATVFGSGINRVNIRPTAMLVDKCENVYVSGWGGLTNSSHNPNVANTFGLPVTADATQATTDGSDFYFIVFEREATGLLYATFFGGNISREHVDGGTSRFDQDGIIYQAVCAGCGGHDDFPTTPGAWSNTNNSSNCNLGVIKYRFDFEEIEAGASAFPDSIGCVNLPVTFQNHSVNAVDYFWDFGDGATSTDFEPFHLYTDTGVYQVMLVAIDSTKCIPADTAWLTIRALVPIDTTYAAAAICRGESAFLGGAWQTASGVYTDVYTSRYGCDSTVITTLEVRDTYVDTTFAWICLGDSVPFFGTWVGTAGTYTQTFGTTGGCDSSFTLVLNVGTETYAFETLRLCDGDSAFLGGAWQSASGTWADTTVVPGGCDTIRVTTLQLIRYDVTDSLRVCLGDSVFAAGAWQTAAGSWTDSLASAEGCDSVVTTVLEILPPDSVAVATALCAGDSVFAGGAWQTAAGSYVDVWTNAQGCDSVVTTTVTLLPVAAGADTVRACPGDPLLGITGPGGGTFTDTLVAANGCDSLVVVTVIALPAATGTDAVTICAGDSVWLDGWQSTAGTWTNTLVAANGCDSVVSVTLSVLDTVMRILPVEICAGDSAFVLGQWTGTAGVYADTFAAANGCDSIVGVQLIVRPRHDATVAVDLCGGDSVFLAGAWQSAPGTVVDTFASAFGCDSVVRYAIDTLPRVWTRVDVGLCPGDSAWLGGTWFSGPGSYVDTLASAAGCDSVVYGSVFVHPVPVVNATASVCVGDSAFLGGAWQTGSGTYVDTLVSAVGCDSIVRTALSVLPTASSFPDRLICGGDSLFVGGAWQTTAGTYVDVLGAANGCDSVVMTILAVDGGIFDAGTVALCAGDSVFAAGAWQTAPGVYYDSLTASGGCDSVRATTVTVGTAIRDTLDVFLCAGDSVFLAGAWRDLPGTFTSFGSTAAGCDSFTTWRLEVRLPVTTTLVEEICQGDSAFIQGQWWTAPGTYRDTLAGANGCDSIVRTTLYVRPVYVLDRDTSICFGETIVLGGAPRGTSGVYRDTFLTVRGCDSIVRTTLTVLPVTTSAVSLSLCAGDSVFAGGAWQTAAGTYFDTYVSAAGCDSIVQTNVSLRPNAVRTISALLCAGDSVLAGSLGWVSAPGIYRDTLVAANGCDSIVRYVVSTGGAVTDTVAVSICAGDAWFAAGAWQTTAGTYTDTYAGASGCDSVVVTVLSVLPDRLVSVVVPICAGDSVFAGGAWQTTPGFYADVFGAANGCDSTVITQVQLLPTPVLLRNRQICAGDSIFLAGAWQGTAGVYDDVFALPGGCDSIVRTTLTVVPPAFASRTVTLCPGGVTWIGGVPVSAPGTYVDTVPAFSGCDSIRTITVVVLPELFDTVRVTLCPGDSVFAAGGWQSAAGAYADTYTAAAGCDSTVTTLVQVAPGDTTHVALQACAGDSVALGSGPGAIWTDQSGTYLVSLTGAAGCDSVVAYTVTVLAAARDTVTVTACAGDGVFAGGGFQTVAGFYADTLTAASGCDSVVVTELRLLPTWADTVVVNACFGDAVFAAGAWQTTPGLYTDAGLTAAGCDSLRTVDLRFGPAALAFDTLMICAGDSAFLGGAWQTLGGTYVDTIDGGAACDTVRSTLLIPVTVTTSQTLWLCDGDSLWAGGAWQTATGLFVDTLASAMGCDSIVYTTVLVSPTESYYVERILCAGDSAFLAGAWQATAGLYVDTFANALGCDSILQTQLSFTPYYYTFDTITICEGDSIPGLPRPSGAWSGAGTASGEGGPSGGIALRRDGSVTYLDTLVASGGCDSLVEITVIEVPVSIGSDAWTLCAGDSVWLGGQWVSGPGVYVDTLVNAGGCDSINFVTISVVDTFQTWFTAEICAGDSVPVGGGWATASGLYADTLTATTGCDSILWLDLTVHPSPVVTIPVDLCLGDSVWILGQWVNGPAVLDDSLATVHGCDSIRRYVIDTVPVLRNRIDVAVCDGDSAFLAGAWQSVPGSYTQAFPGSGGCDSIVTWTLSLLPTYAVGLNVTLCGGDSVFAGGAWQSAAGVYTDVYGSVAGCDSSVITTVSLLPSTGSSLSAEVCVGDSAFFAGSWYTTPGTRTAVYPAANGCDSVVTFTLALRSGFARTDSVRFCAGDSVFLAGAWRSTPGTWTDSLVASGGCDSVVTTVVETLPAYAETRAVSLCAGDSVFLAGAWRSTPGTWTEAYTSAGGCDSTITTTVSVRPLAGSVTLVEICPGDSVFAAGAWQTAGGWYADTLTAAGGCDSVARTQVILSPVLHDTVYAEICEGSAWYAGGAWQTASGVYLDSALAPGGCVQRTTTVLTVRPAWAISLPVEACAGDSVFAGGAWQTASGSYVDAYTTAAGCDSVVTTVLTVRAPIAVTRETGFCEGDSVFAAGAWQTTAGSYVDTYVSASGCDSVVTTVVEEAPVSIVTVDVSLCQGESFWWNGDSVQVGGEFFLVLTSSAGCDSVLIYDVSFSPLAVDEEQRRICAGDSTEIFGQWVGAAGTYADTVAVPGSCPEIRRVVLEVAPRVALEAPDTLLCLGDSVRLQTIGGTNWHWTPDPALSCLDCPAPWAFPTSTTVFTVTTTDACALDSVAEALVEVYPPPVVEASGDLTVAPGQPVTLSASGEGNGPLLYWWEAGGNTLCTDCPDYTVTPTTGTTYTVWVEDGLGCRASDELRLGVDNSCVDGRMHPANAFSPNGDGHNDRFVIRYDGPATVQLVRIYNRWGELLYETEDPTVQWDGTFRGKLVDPGVYVYYLEGLCEEDRTFFHVGNVTLIR